MLVRERKKITRITTKLDDNEIAALNDVHSLIDFCIAVLDENKAKEFISEVTGEVIERDELSRVLGIISGLEHCREWGLE